MLTAFFISMAGFMLIVYSCLIVASNADDQTEQAQANNEEHFVEKGRISHAERINVLFIAPKQPPCVRQIVNDLRSKQELVEGHIEIVRPFDNNIVAVCNDEGVINGMPFNRELNNGTFIFGPMFLCKERLGEDGYQLDGLNETELVRYQKQFAKPEVLVNWGGHYMALPMAYSTKL